MVWAQTYVYATMNGNPTINTSGWLLAGDAQPGDTPGDADTNPNELILTFPYNYTSGAAFYDQPLNLTACTRWTCEFEFRINDSSDPVNHADGLAFCFLDVPPSGYVTGFGVGIPGTANGLKVVFDTFDNGCNGPNPEIQIRYGAGYDECWAQPTVINTGGSLNFIRGNYNSARITYNNGVIQVFVNNVLYLTGNYLINFTGYLGFTAGTGGYNDRHSLRNVIIYTDMPVSDAGLDGSYCSGDSLQIGSANNAAYTYQWSPSAGLSNPTASNPYVNLVNNTNAPIVQTYVVTTALAINTACPSTDTVVVTIKPSPTSNFTIDTTLCTGVNTALTYNGTLITGAVYNWNLSGAAIVSGSGAGPYTLNWTTPGNKPVSLSVTANGCTSSTQTSTVSVNQTPTSQFIAPGPYCAGQDITVTYTGNATAAATYNWNFNGAVITSGSAQGPYQINWPATGNDQISLTVIENTCTSTVSNQNITVNAIPTANFTVPAPQCFSNNSYSFNGTGTFGAGATFAWSFPGANPAVSTQQNPTGIVFSAPGNFPVSFTITENGCSNTPLVQNVGVLAQPTVNFSSTPVSGCNPLTVTFSNTTTPAGGLNAIWDFGNGAGDTSLTPTYTYPDAGVYTVTLIMTDNFCGDTLTLTNYITVYQTPTAGFQLNPDRVFIDNPYIQVTDLSQNANFWSYTSTDGQSFSSADFTMEFSNPGTYTIEQFVSTVNGCVDSTTAEVIVEPITLAFVPNTFTPNEDDVNDSWKPILSYIKNYQVRIFDRWGDLLYYGDDIYKGWNGRVNNSGTMVKSGQYFYKIEYVDAQGVDKELYGTVNLVR